MRPGEHVLAPGIEEGPVGTDDDHRVGAPVEQVDAILPVHRDGGNVTQFDLVG